MMQKMRDEEISKKAAKAKQIQKEEAQMKDRNRKFYESRVQMAKNNHSSKVQRSLSEKAKMERKIKKLKKKQLKIIENYQES